MLILLTVLLYNMEGKLKESSSIFLSVEHRKIPYKEDWQHSYKLLNINKIALKKYCR